jgi:hypothetical protein
MVMGMPTTVAGPAVRSHPVLPSPTAVQRVRAVHRCLRPGLAPDSGTVSASSPTWTTRFAGFDWPVAAVSVRL